MTTVQINSDWHRVLEAEFSQVYFKKIRGFLTKTIADKRTIYPHPRHIFVAFDQCPWQQLKVVILGQDPYHGQGQAHGLAFSVAESCPLPPSLKNIYQELHTDLGLPLAPHGQLTAWAEQGMLLLNASLTVEAHQPNSHSHIGWQTFTDNVIKKISAEKSGVVFLLWGNFARAKKDLIDQQKHFILEAAHPSPFSVHKGFFGCRHFSKTNEILRFLDRAEIDWRIQ